jgi:hypothetical protein
MHVRKRVDLEVDEPRHSDAAPIWRGEADRGHLARSNLDISANDPPADECGLDSKSHVVILAGERL